MGLSVFHYGHKQVLLWHLDSMALVYILRYRFLEYINEKIKINANLFMFLGMEES